VQEAKARKRAKKPRMQTHDSLNQFFNPFFFPLWFDAAQEAQTQTYAKILYANPRLIPSNFFPVFFPFFFPFFFPPLVRRGSKRRRHALFSFLFLLLSPLFVAVQEAKTRTYANTSHANPRLPQLFFPAFLFFSVSLTRRKRRRHALMTRPRA